MIAIAPDKLARALAAFAEVVGPENVWQGEEAQLAYADAMAPRDPLSYAPLAAVAPGSAEEVQAIVRIAAELVVPLWPISRGKNFGYGGAAPHIEIGRAHV